MNYADTIVRAVRNGGNGLSLHEVAERTGIALPDVMQTAFTLAAKGGILMEVPKEAKLFVRRPKGVLVPHHQNSARVKAKHALVLSVINRPMTLKQIMYETGLSESSVGGYVRALVERGALQEYGRMYPKRYLPTSKEKTHGHTREVPPVGR